MNFKNLKDKCLYYRNLTDYKLLPNSYVMLMLDGRGFSKAIKNKFNKPFDDDFIYMMNETAKYLCENIQGCKFAYVQSDEISLILTDFDTPTTDSFFCNRISKIQSIAASMATGKFNQLMLLHRMKNGFGINPEDVILKSPIYQFDCKCWNVPSFNDVFAWFLYRQNDCIKNSKQQTAQTFLSHKILMGKTSDEQIELLKNEKGIDWNDLSNDKKYGRFLVKNEVTMTNEENGSNYYRYIWKYEPALLLSNHNGKSSFLNMNLIPNISNV
jgi:tRNA(His) 5'-end guanylyltransferase